ncbi:MAG: hypothetical protein WBB82_11660, partial [Limnothrix sp.]
MGRVFCSAGNTANSGFWACGSEVKLIVFFVEMGVELDSVFGKGINNSITCNSSDKEMPPHNTVFGRSPPFGEWSQAVDCSGCSTS